MTPKLLLTASAFCMASLTTRAQEKLSIDKVMTVYLQSSGTIKEQGQVKGYYFFYQSDKIDKHTNEYTVQILDQNLNKVKDIKFNDSKNVELMEGAYNGNSLSFLFNDKDQKILETRVYDMNGKLMYTYSKTLDKKSEDWLDTYEKQHDDDAVNQQMFSLKDQGFAMLIPLRDGKQYTYEANFYSSTGRNQWTYSPADDERLALASFLGNTDSLMVLEVTKRERRASGQTSAAIVGLNFATRKKAFELDASKDKFTFVPQYATQVKGTGNVLLMGSYYDKTANILKDFSLGLAMYVVTPSGEVISKSYNSWKEDIGKYLPLNDKGKIDDIGYLYFHNMIQTQDGNMFAVGEGYKRVADGLGIGLNALSMMAAHRVSSGGNTKMKITDMVLLKFGPDFKITGATIQDKTDNSFSTGLEDLASQHMIAQMMKAMGAFDYAFTSVDKDNKIFTVCYNDYERSKDFKGETFNTIRYNGTKFTTDKMQLTSKATTMKVLQGKPGSIAVVEYFKKDKKLDVHLEKMN